MNYHKNINRAFTFIEVMIATVVLILGLIPIFTFFISTTSDISLTIDELAATTYANELIDGVLSFSYDEIPNKIPETNVKELIDSDHFFKKFDKLISKMNPGYERFIEIESSSFNFSVPPMAGAYMCDKIKKLNSYKKIIARVRYTVKNAVSRELKISSFAVRNDKI